MSTISLDPKALAARLRADEKGAPKAVLRALRAGAQRGRALMVSRSPVDRGILRNAWKVIKVSDEQVNLENDQPYAGVLERGARPFKISRAGLEALAGWVKRKILRGNYNTVKHGPDTRSMDYKTARKAQLAHKRAGKAYKHLALWQLDAEAMRIARAIAKKWEKLGKRGTYFIRDSLPKLAELIDKEMTRSLEKFFNRSRGSGSTS